MVIPVPGSCSKTDEIYWFGWPAQSRFELFFFYKLRSGVIPVQGPI